MARRENNTPPRRTGKIELVLGGGGIKGFGHIGLLKAIEEKQIDIGTVTGVSIGSVVAALYTNGYTPDQINRIFLTELMGLDPESLKRTMRLPSIARWFKSGFIDLASLFAELVKKYELRPQDNLKILAYNVIKGAPVVFEGRDYDLSKAISASCAIPGVMRPVWSGRKPESTRDQAKTLARSWRGQTEESILVDGGIHHPNPGEFCKDQAIISKLRFANRLPDERLPLVDLGFHLVEMFWSYALDRYFPDPENHLVIDTGLPNVACLSFGISRRKCKQMVDYGYRKAARALDRAIRQGKVPVKDDSAA